MFSPVNCITPVIFIALSLIPTRVFSQRISTRNYTGVATNPKNNETLFIAKFSEKHQNGELLSMETSYFDPSGLVKIAHRKVVFKKNSYAPNFVFHNIRTGGTEVLLVNEDHVEIQFKKSESSAVEKTVLKNIPPPIVADAGLVELIRDNWEYLLAGNKKELSIVVPSRLDYYSFYLKQKPSKNKEVITISFESNHWLIRQLVAPILLSFDSKNKQLMKYEGTTNLTDENGDLFVKAIITYQFEK